MKKYLLLFLTAILLSGNARPQFTSEGFENWENGNPVNWFTSNLSPIYVPVTQTNDTHGGNYAVRGETIPTQQGQGYPPILSAGINAQGFPVNFRPQSINGWYKFHSDSGDAFNVSVAMIKNGQAIGSGGFYTMENTAVYKQFSANINYFSNEVPDTAQIVVVISNIRIVPGAIFVLDDLSLGGVTDVSDVKEKMKYALDQNFPNPFNPVTTIHFQIPADEFVTLKVFNSIGQEVVQLVNEQMNPGDYEYDFNTGNLPSGVYVYRLQAGSFTQSRKMLVLK